MSAEPVSPLEFISDENPFKAIRLNMGMTQVELARKAHISKHAIIRNEQAMAVEPYPKLLNYFAENFPVTVYSLRTQYERFQISQRVKAGRLLGSISNKLSVWDQTSERLRAHPLEFLRTLAHPQLNPTSLSKALCLNQSVINHFEQEYVHQKTVPEQLLVALKQAGYPDPELDSLVSAYEQYRYIKLGLRNVNQG